MTCNLESYVEFVNCILKKIKQSYPFVFDSASRELVPELLH